MVTKMSETQSSSNFALIFPGQGSQSVGMMNELSGEFSCVKTRFEQASEVVGRDLWALVNEGPEEDLNLTENTQPVMLAASMAVADIWQLLGGPAPRWVAGHSFGEYSALVYSGAMTFSEGVSIAQARGTSMPS